MRLSIAIAAGLFLLASLGCTRERRSEKLEGTWYGVTFGRGVGAVVEARKFSVTFGKDGSYKTTATCTGSEGRAKTTFKCDGATPIEAKFKLKIIHDDRVTFSLPPSSDQQEVAFNADGTARYRMWQTGLWLTMSRTEPPPPPTE